MSRIEFFKPEDFIEPVCIGPAKDVLRRLAEQANKILNDRMAFDEKGNCRKKVPSELTPAAKVYLIRGASNGQQK